MIKPFLFKVWTKYKEYIILFVVACLMIYIFILITGYKKNKFDEVKTI